MANKSHLDDLINFKENVILSISQSQKVLSLISNNPNIVVDSAEAESIIDNNVFNFDFVPTTQQASTAIILIDTDMVRASSPTMNRYELYVQVIVSKEFMSLRGQGFVGLKGTRRDNIARFVDLLLNNSLGYGVGRLTLETAITASVPDGYTSKLLTYSTPDFARDRKLGNV